MHRSSNYKLIVKQRVEASPKKGRGLYSQLAKHLSISTVLVSQIFNGEKDLTVDQALLVTEFFNFNLLEREYFILLVCRDRASNHKLKKYYVQKINKLILQFENLKKRVPVKDEFTDEVKQEFYSDWLYGGLRMAAGLPQINSPKDLANYFGVNLKDVEEKIDFLLKYNLIKIENGKIDFGNQSTHISNQSPFINSHDLPPKFLHAFNESHCI